MEIIERFALSKHGHDFDCEDKIVLSRSHAAIIDGATARTSVKYNGLTTGRMAAALVSEVIESLQVDATLQTILTLLKDHFRAFYARNSIQLSDYSALLTASAAIYSDYYRQIWLIGDCKCRVGNVVYDNPNGIDDITSSLRCFINQSLILKGRNPESISEKDPGAQFILPLLKEQFVFQNSFQTRLGSYRYAAIDGRDVPIDLVKTIELDSEVHEIIMSSDGYPILESTLCESEQQLAMCLRNDPLCIYENKSVKCIKSGLVSYDDRAYIRLKI